MLFLYDLITSICYDCFPLVRNLDCGVAGEKPIFDYLLCCFNLAILSSFTAKVGVCLPNMRVENSLSAGESFFELTEIPPAMTSLCVIESKNE